MRVMLTAEQIREKIYRCADAFEEHYRAGQYSLAKYDYDTASTMAVFMELPPEDMYELFQNHNPDDDGDPIWGRFNLDKTRECYLWCIRRGQTNEVMPFHKPRAPL